MGVEGREPEGIVKRDEYEGLRRELISRLEAITDEEGRNIGTRAFRPQAIYRECNNVPPDLIVYFGDLSWRSVGSVGMASIYTHENDTGPDDANHAVDGLFILTGDGIPSGENRDGASILQVGPTILSRFGYQIPPDMVAQPIV